MTHLLLDSWVVYPVHWGDIGYVFPAPGTTRNRGRGDPLEMLGGHMLAGWGLLEVEVSSPLTLQGGVRTWLVQASRSHALL